MMDSQNNIKPNDISTNATVFDAKRHENENTEQRQPIGEDVNPTIVFESRTEPVRAPRKKDNFRGIFAETFTPEGSVKSDSSLGNDDSLSQDDNEAGLCMEVEEIQNDYLDDTFEDEVGDEPGPNPFSKYVSRNKGKSIQRKSSAKKSSNPKSLLKSGSEQPQEVHIVVNQDGQVYRTTKQVYGTPKETGIKAKNVDRKFQQQPKVKFSPKIEFEPSHTYRSSSVETSHMKSSNKSLPWTRPLPVGERCCPCLEGTKCILCPCAQDHGKCTPGCRVKLCRFQPGNEKHNPGCEVRMVPGKSGSTVNVSWPKLNTKKETAPAHERVGNKEKTASPSTTHSLLETDQDFWDKMVLGKKSAAASKAPSMEEPEDTDDANTTHIQIVKQLDAMTTYVSPSPEIDMNAASTALNGDEMHIEFIVMSEDDDFIDDEDREDFDEYVIGSPDVKDPENQSLYDEKYENISSKKLGADEQQRAKTYVKQSDKMVTEIKCNEQGNFEVQIHPSDSNNPASSLNEALYINDLPKPSTVKQPRKKSNRFKVNPLPDEMPPTLGPLTIEIDDEQETEKLAEPKFVQLMSPKSSKNIQNKAKPQPKTKKKKVPTATLR